VRNLLGKIVACAVGFSTAVGCGGSEKSTDPGTRPDGGATAGASGAAGGGGSAGNGGAGGGLGGAAGSLGGSGGGSGCLCLSDCGLGVCDPVTRCCVDCAKDEDCNRFGSTGAVCVRPGQFCGCASDTNCATNPAGRTCLASQKCGCQQASDCSGSSAGPACAPSTHQCGCGADTDCKGALPRCDVATGRCVACASNADCTDPDFAACDPDSHSCTSCFVDADCARSSLGRYCYNGICRCRSDGECTTSPRGPHCDPFDPPDNGVRPDGRACGCHGDTECAQSSLGSRCVADTFSYRLCGRP
jgi:hypothetical protein